MEPLEAVRPPGKRVRARGQTGGIVVNQITSRNESNESRNRLASSVCLAASASSRVNKPRRIHSDRDLQY